MRQPTTSVPTEFGNRVAAQSRAAAIEAAFRLEFERLCRYVFRHTGDAELAEDIVQQAFVEAMAASPHLDDARPLGPWLMTTVQRRVIDHRRGDDRRAHHPRVTEPATAPARNADDILEAVVRAETIERLVAELRRMPEPQKVVVTMKLFGDQSFAEISHCLHIRPEAARQLYHRALVGLRTQLDEPA